MEIPYVSLLLYMLEIFELKSSPRERILLAGVDLLCGSSSPARDVVTVTQP